MTGGQSQLPVEQIPAPSLLYDEQLEYVSWKKKWKWKRWCSLGKFTSGSIVLVKIGYRLGQDKTV